MAARTAAHAARYLAAGGLRQNERSVRDGAEDSDVSAHWKRHLRDGCRARRGTDFPLHLRGGGLHQARQPAVDFIPDAGRHPQRTRRGEARNRIRTAGGCGTGTEPGGLAGGDESFARLYADVRWRPLGGTRADADAGHAGRTRAGNPQLRSGRLPRGHRDVPARGQAGRCRV